MRPLATTPELQCVHALVREVVRFSRTRLDRDMPRSPRLPRMAG